MSTTSKLTSSVHIATDSSRDKTKWVHRVDLHIDRERNWIETGLLYIGAATAYADVDRPNAPRKIAVMQLANVNAPTTEKSPAAKSNQP
jgi:hypothetical protein